MRNPTFHRRRQERLRREDALRSQHAQRQAFMVDVREQQRVGTRLGVEEAVATFLGQRQTSGSNAH